jgi:hypothetical protein
MNNAIIFKEKNRENVKNRKVLTSSPNNRSFFIMLVTEFKISGAGEELNYT